MQNLLHRVAAAVIIVTAVFMSACGRAASTPAGEGVFEASATMPVTAGNQSTLPPTWTPTTTATPARATATITLTPTPTVTPTLDVATLCERFTVTTNLRSGQYFAWDSQITLFVQAVAPDTTVRLTATHRLNGEKREADLPGGQANILQLPIGNLPQTGQYNWSLSLLTDTYGEICGQSGYFIATSRESTRAEEARIR